MFAPGRAVWGVLLFVLALAAMLLVSNESGTIANLDADTFGYVALGVALLVFIGGGKPEVAEYEDGKLMLTVRSELFSLLGIAAQPVAYKIFRWKDGFPQAEVGHLDLIDEIEKYLPENVVLAGSSYRGIAIPDCIRQGRNAVHKILTAQGTRNTKVHESAQREVSP